MFPLRLLTLDAVPAESAAEFRAGTHWLAMLLVGAVVGFSLWVGWQGGIRIGKEFAPLGWLGWWVGIVLGLYWLLLANLFRKALKPTAWLVRADHSGLYVKWRSHQNQAWPSDGPQVVFVPYSGIAGARQHKRRWSTPQHRHGGSREVRHAFLELQLRDADTAELARHLADERAGKPGGKPVKGARWGHYPVSLEPGDLLRIEWDATPRIETLLALLREHGVTVTEPLRTEKDLTRHATQADLEELARRGDLMTLERAMRAGSDLSLEEAHARAKAMIAGAHKP